MRKGNKNTTSERCVHPTVIEAFVTIAQVWTQPKCPPVDKWIRRVCYICDGTLLSIGKGELVPFGTTWLELEGVMPREVSQTDRVKYRMLSLTYGL